MVGVPRSDVWALSHFGQNGAPTTRPKSAAGSSASSKRAAHKIMEVPGNYLLYHPDGPDERRPGGPVLMDDSLLACPLVLQRASGRARRRIGHLVSRSQARVSPLEETAAAFECPKKFPKSDSVPQMPAGVLTTRTLGAPPVLDPRQPLSFWFLSGTSSAPLQKANQGAMTSTATTPTWAEVRDADPFLKPARAASLQSPGSPLGRMTPKARRNSPPLESTLGRSSISGDLSPRSPSARRKSGVGRRASAAAVKPGLRRTDSAEQAMHEMWAQGVLGTLSSYKAEAASQRSPKMDIVAMALNSRGMNESLSTFVQRRHCIPGAPTMDEVLERGSLGWEGWLPGERLRVQRAHRRYWQVFETEVEKRDLPRILTHIGYLACTDAVVFEIAESFSDLNMFNLEELVKVVEQFALREQSEIMAIAACYMRTASKLALNPDSPSKQRRIKLSRRDLPGLLRDLDAFPPAALIEDLLLVAGLKVQPPVLGEAEVMQFLAAYREAEGLSSTEVDLAKEIFDMFAPEVYDLHHTGTLERELPLRLLNEALLERYTFRAKSVIDSMVPDDLEKRSTQGVSFQEFCIWTRLVRDRLLKNMWQEFDVLELDEDDCLALNHARNVLNTLGYTLDVEALREFLIEAQCSTEDPISFDGFVQLVRCVQAQEGFMLTERQELKLMFERFDQEQKGELTRRMCLDLLRYAHGMSLRVDVVNRIIDEADANGNDTMDFGEFLIVMRGYREIEVAQDRQAYNDHACPELRMLRIRSLPGALEQVGQNLEEEVRQELGISLGKGSSLPPETPLTFDDFVKLVDRCRRIRVAILRKQASFTDAEFIYIGKRFQACTKQNTDYLEVGDLLWLLIALGCKLTTAAERTEVLEMLDEARACAVDAGVSEQEAGARNHVTVFLLVHLLRAIIRQKEVIREAREVEAAEKAGFTATEVAEFRKVFTRWIAAVARGQDDSSQPGSPRGDLPSAFSPRQPQPLRRNRRSIEHAPEGMTSSFTGGSGSFSPRKERDTLGSRASTRVGFEVPDDPSLHQLMDPEVTIRHSLRGLGDTVPLKAFLDFLRSTRLRESCRKGEWNGLLALADRLANEDGEEGDGLDFANFLVLMRWAKEHELGRLRETNQDMFRRLSRVNFVMPPAMTLMPAQEQEGGEEEED